MENWLTFILLLGGISLQIWNIITYASFLRRSSQDVLSSGDKSDRVLSLIALILLLFFLTGYVVVIVTGIGTLLIGYIFFFGALFCTIMIHLVAALTTTVKRRSIHVVKAMVKVAEERDSNLNGHSLYVQNIAMTIWRHLPDNLKAKINEVDLEYAALLHDIGKMGIPESVLNKPGKLNEEEWSLMKQHPKKGVEILKELPSFERIIPWIEYHHERIDGKGYYGIKGDRIPLASKIIAIADTYSAITMRRSYKPPKSYEAAIQIIKEVAGTQLDAQLVNLFLTIPKEELKACAPKNIEILTTAEK